jgi:hypothetical protein
MSSRPQRQSRRRVAPRTVFDPAVGTTTLEESSAAKRDAVGSLVARRTGAARRAGGLRPRLYFQVAVVNGEALGERSWSHWGGSGLKVAMRSVGCPWTYDSRLRSAGASTVDGGTDRPPSSVLSSSVSVPPKLRVTGAYTENMPFYLRTFFRVLSSWVHYLKSQVRGTFRGP